MLRILYLIIILFLVVCKNDKQEKFIGNQQLKTQPLKDYVDFKYDKVIAFASVDPMDYYGDNFNEKLDVKKFKDTISKTLDSVQIKKLNDILSGRKNKKTDSVTAVADCFYPRHNIIFLKGKKIINHIAVCFECNQIKSNKHPFANMNILEDFFNSINLKVFYNPLEHKRHYDSLRLPKQNKF